MQCLHGLGVGAQGKVLFLQAHPEHVGIERRHLLEPLESLTDAVQGANPTDRHHGGQQQNQGKAQTQLACHAQVGKKTTFDRTHRTSPTAPATTQCCRVATATGRAQDAGAAIMAKGYESVVFRIAQVALFAAGTPGRVGPEHRRH
ncbi:hypothetical protein D3C77_563160 [compost metagenome]